MSRDRDDAFSEEPLPPEDEEGGRRPRRRFDEDEGPPKKKDSNLGLILGIVGGAVFLLCAGCGIGGYFLWQGAKSKFEEAQDRAQRSNDLKQLGLACHNFQTVWKRGPANLAELQPFLADAGPTLQRVRKGDIVMIWNADPTRQVQGASNVILGYDNRPEANGNRLVLFADGSVRPLPEAEFNNTPKAEQTPRK